MDKTGRNESVKQLKKRNILIRILMWGCMITVFFLIARWMGVREIPQVSLDDCITTDLVRLDGSTEHSDSNLFSLPKKGEKLVFTVTLPDQANSIDHPVLCFFNYNSVITIRQDGQEIYAHGQDKMAKGIPTGHTIVRAALTDTYSGTITIEFLQQEDNTLSNFADVCLLPAEYAWLYPVRTLSLQISLFLFLAFAIFSMGIFAFNTIIRKRGDSIQGFMLSLFGIAITTWALGYTGTLFVISNNDTVVPYLEYTATYLMPVFFTAYMLTGSASYGWRRKVCVVLEALFLVLFLTATGLQIFSSSHDGYLILLNTLYAGFLIGGLFFAFITFRDRTSAGRIIRIGVILTIILAMMEVAAAALGRAFDASDSTGLKFTTQAITPTIVLIFQTTLMADYMSRVYKAYLQRKEMDRLEEIAYTDALTGLENRAAFDEKYIMSWKKRRIMQLPSLTSTV